MLSWRHCLPFCGTLPKVKWSQLETLGLGMRGRWKVGGRSSCVLLAQWASKRDHVEYTTTEWTRQIVKHVERWGSAIIIYKTEYSLNNDRFNFTNGKTRWVHQMLHNAIFLWIASLYPKLCLPYSKIPCFISQLLHERSWPLIPIFHVKMISSKDQAAIKRYLKEAV